MDTKDSNLGGVGGQPDCVGAGAQMNGVGAGAHLKGAGAQLDGIGAGAHLGKVGAQLDGVGTRFVKKTISRESYESFLAEVDSLLSKLPTKEELSTPELANKNIEKQNETLEAVLQKVVDIGSMQYSEAMASRRRNKIDRVIAVVALAVSIASLVIAFCR